MLGSKTDSYGVKTSSGLNSWPLDSRRIVTYACRKFFQLHVYKNANGCALVASIQRPGAHGLHGNVDAHGMARAQYCHHPAGDVGLVAWWTDHTRVRLGEKSDRLPLPGRSRGVGGAWVPASAGMTTTPRAACSAGSCRLPSSAGRRRRRSSGGISTRRPWP